MRITAFADVPPREIAPGYLGRYVHSDQITQGQVEVAEDAVIPEHSHPHEQWTLIVSGTLEITVAGVSHLLHAGQVMQIGPHERHAARALSPCRVLDVFHPVREDYR